MVTDGRFSGATHGLMAGHVSPEAASGGPIALLRDGDTVSFDIKARRLEVKLSAAELQQRRRRWRPPTPRYLTGVMGKYAQLVASPSEGAVTGTWRSAGSPRRARHMRRSPRTTEAPPAPNDHGRTGPVKAGPVPTRWNGTGRKWRSTPKGISRSHGRKPVVRGSQEVCLMASPYVKPRVRVMKMVSDTMFTRWRRSSAGRAGGLRSRGGR